MKINKLIFIIVISLIGTGSVWAQFKGQDAVSVTRSSFTAPDSIPNYFRPDIDILYTIVPKDTETMLSFFLYNRYGMLIYSKKAPIITWDGRTNSGVEVNTGVYYYILEAENGDSPKLYQKKGFIHLFR